MTTGMPQHSPRPAIAPTTVSNAHKKIKREQLDDNDTAWETHPRTPQEHHMVSQLRQMGFTDMREMLAGIRHVSSPTDMQAQVDAAMIWIVVRD
jgi:hypothetical protein